MLTDTSLNRILDRIPHLTIGVAGDLFLDLYLDLDAELTEPSIETGLDAYQVVGVRCSPGAAGTVINNLASLGVGRICAVSVIGEDGQGDDLRRALARLAPMDLGQVFVAAGQDFRTPTYMKPMLGVAGQLPRELNRLDIKNRRPLPAAAEEAVLRGIAETWPKVDGLIVLDQVSQPDCGVITGRVRDQLANLGAKHPDRPGLADSRERIGLFRSLWLKPNQQECARAVHLDAGGPEGSEEYALTLARRAGRPVFCTQGEAGILLVDPRRASPEGVLVPGYPVHGPIDIVGAGDSTSAGIICAVAAGASLEEAAAFGNLVASITIQQIGTTGTATPEQVRQRWREVSGNQENQ